MQAEKIITTGHRDEIKAAISKAEKLTSGEIRVFVEDNCKMTPLDRAAQLFELLKMHQTKERNGVLIYVSVVDHKYAIIGDAGIHRHVKDEFWNKLSDNMVEHFKQGEIYKGIIHAVHEAANVLSKHFPCQKDDKDELSNDIIFGND